jgi:AbrB family looped-hinge helix DNA binding protein
MHAALTSKGQMTLPGPVRSRLGLEAGDQLLVPVVDADTIVPKRKPAAPGKPLRGLLARLRRALIVEQMDEGVAAHRRAKHGGKVKEK